MGEKVTFSKGEIAREKNIIFFQPNDKDSCYKLDINTGELYGLKGKPISTIPPFINTSYKIIEAQRSLPQELQFLKKYIYLYRSGMFHGVNIQDTGVLLTLDKIYNAIGDFAIEYCSYEALIAISEHFKEFIRYIKQEQEATERTLTPYDLGRKIHKFPQWYTNKCIVELFELNKFSEDTSKLLSLMITAKNMQPISKQDAHILGWYADHQLQLFFKDESSYMIEKYLTRYFQMCKDLDIPMTKKSNFMSSYNAIKREWELRKAEIDQAKLAKVYSEHEEAFSYEDEKYIAVIPKTPDDFIAEGRQQGNCVAGYVDKVMNNVSYVLFLRKKENPEQSYLTVDVRIHERTNKPYIYQFLLSSNRYISDCQDTAEREDLIYLQKSFNDYLLANWDK